MTVKPYQNGPTPTIALPWEPGAVYPSVGGGKAPFNPSQLAGILLWLRGDRGVIPGTGVLTWQDGSGQANDVTQAVGVTQPTTTTLNGQAALAFSGIQHLDRATSIFGAGVARTIICVGQVDAAGIAPNGGTVLESRATNTPHRTWLFQSGGNCYVYSNITTVSAAVVASLAATFQAPFLGVWSHPAAGTTPCVFSLNGTARTADAAAVAATGSAGMTLGFSRAAASTGWAGKMAEIIALDHQITVPETAQIKAYVIARYGIAVA